MSLIQTALIKPRQFAISQMTDTCDIYSEDAGTTKLTNGNSIVNSAFVQTTACLVNQDTSDNSKRMTTDMSSTVDYKVFIMPYDVDIGVNHYIKYKGRDYKITKINQNTNIITRIVYGEAVLK